jgi:hypothetical protein
MSRPFDVGVGGTDDEYLIVGFIQDGSTSCVIKLAAVPVKVVVTPNWGFIGVNEAEYASGKPHYSLSVLNINGFFGRISEFPYSVTRWTVWTSTDGFDFMLQSRKAVCVRCVLPRCRLANMQVQVGAHRSRL